MEEQPKYPQSFEERMQDEAPRATADHTKEALAKLPVRITKQAIQTLAEEIVTKYDDRPLSGYIRLKAQLEVIETAMNKLKPYATTEASKYNGESNMEGAKFKYNEGARTFDFSNDKEWNRLKKELKEREEFLKGLKKEMCETDTGEISRPPIIKYRGESINISFK